MFFKIFIIKIKDAPLKGIDHMCVTILVISFVLPPICHMYMTMNKETGLVLVHQSIEYLESLMGKIPSVVKLVGGGVCQQNIKSFFTEKFEAKLFYTFDHFFFRILVYSRLVAHGTSQTEDAYTFMLINLILDANTAFRRDPFIFIIMITVYIQYRCRGKSGEKRKISGVQIPAGEYQIDTLQLFFFKKIPQIFWIELTFPL